MLYKKLTFMLIENHSDAVLREQMLRNFMQLFNNYPSIPIEILLEPFIT
jgi:hypothetical protein